jgi:hypothetical protein
MDDFFITIDVRKKTVSPPTAKYTALQYHPLKQLKKFRKIPARTPSTRVENQPQTCGILSTGVETSPQTCGTLSTRVERSPQTVKTLSTHVESSPQTVRTLSTRVECLPGASRSFSININLKYSYDE